MNAALHANYQVFEANVILPQPLPRFGSELCCHDDLNTYFKLRQRSFVRRFVNPVVLAVAVTKVWNSRQFLI